MRKQHRAALERPEHKGVVTMSEIARMLEIAIEASWDGSKAVGMNQEVGYYVEESTGRLAWDITRQLTLEVAAVAVYSSQAKQKASLIQG
jgi:hypothetical protein